jgi:hypothetical protein
MGLRFKRVDPDYKTLGAIFLTNDVEEVSLNGSSLFFQSKLHVNGAAGLQRNNLDKVQLLTTRRIIGSLNLSYNLSPSFNVNCNYSNFSSNALPIRDVFTDTIRFSQVTQNEGLTISYGFGNEKNRQMIVSNSSYQESLSFSQSAATFLNQTLTYSINGINGLGITLSMLYNASAGSYGTTDGYGPALGVQKTMMNNKLRIGASSGFQTIRQNKETNAENINVNCNAAYQVDKNQVIKTDFCLLNRKGLVQSTTSFSEVRFSLHYSYTFSANKKTLSKRT